MTTKKDFKYFITETRYCQDKDNKDFVENIAKIDLKTIDTLVAQELKAELVDFIWSRCCARDEGSISIDMQKVEYIEPHSNYNIFSNIWKDSESYIGSKIKLIGCQDKIKELFNYQMMDDNKSIADKYTFVDVPKKNN